MPFCSKCGTKLKDESKFCSSCGAKILNEKNANNALEKESTTKDDASVPNASKVVERIIEREHPKKSGGFSFFLFLILIGVILFLIVNGGVLDEVTKGSGVPYVDPCMRAFENCNYGCGEGLLSGVCKEKCSYDYRKCKNG